MTGEEKQKAIDALKISAPVKAVTQEEFNDYIQTLNKIMDWLEQEPCDDAISRQAVQDYIAKYLSQYLYNDVREAVEVIDEYIGELPSVTPQPKTGHWEWVQYDYNPKLGNWHCSECRCIVVECVDKEEKGGIPLYKYCPQCGAKMIEPQERGDKE